MTDSLEYSRPEVVVDCGCELGEGVLWHPDEGVVYWTDIVNGRLYRYDPLTETHEKVYEKGEIGGLTFQIDGSLLLFMEDGAVRKFDGGKVKTIIKKIPDEVGGRFNDVIADPLGRVFCGTMPKEGRPGRLYRLRSTGKLELLFDDVELPNGMGFSPDKTRFYFTDTRSRRIYVFNYDGTTGEISDRRTFAYVPESNGDPDGLAVDSDGYVWSARWDGGCIVRHDRGGEATERIKLPAKKVTSLSFGGKDYNEIYISTAGGDKRAEEGELAGSLFKITFENLTGHPEFKSRVTVGN